MYCIYGMKLYKAIEMLYIYNIFQDDRQARQVYLIVIQPVTIL